MTKTVSFKVAAASLAFGLATILTPGLSAASQTPDALEFSVPTFSMSGEKATGIIVARRGADDAPGHVRGGGKGRGADDAPNHAWMPTDDGLLFARRGRGADDAPGHVRGGGKGRGADDAPNHAWMPTDDGLLFARRGRGADDAPKHG